MALGHTLLAYVLSFLFLSIYWVNHHLIFHDVGRVNLKIVWCNIIWLFVLSFIPFGTAWVGKHATAWAPVSFYFADMALACIAFHAMCFLIACEHGARKDFKLNARNYASLSIYTLAAGLGGFCPIAAYVAVALVSLWWVIPEKKKEALPDPEKR